MKEEQPSAWTVAEAAVSWSWPMEHVPESKHSRDAATGSSADEIRTRTSKIVLLFLDLARVTDDASYLEVAKAGAKHLAQVWESLATNPTVACAVTDPSFTNGLSRSAFALAEAWKVTKNPVYRDAGLNIIRYIAEMESPAGRALNAAQKREQR